MSIWYVIYSDIGKIWVEKYDQFFADLYASTKDAGTEILPVDEVICVLVKASEWFKLHTPEYPNVIILNEEQPSNKLYPIIEHTGRLIWDNEEHCWNTLSPIYEHTGRLTWLSE